FVNVVGGREGNRTSADLALLLAMVSSLRDRPLPQDLFVNVVGGREGNRTSADLALLLAMVSSLRDRPL
ncbi:hypothetical protein C2U36_27380, partial [Escherichia coli]